MVSILIYYLLLVYQLATLTNLIEELDNASKSIDIVSNTISDTELIILSYHSEAGEGTGESGGE